MDTLLGGLLGAMLGPCWAQEPLKMHAKFWSIFAIDFWSIFFDVGSILGGFWEAFGGHVGLQEPLKSELKFWLDLGCIFYRFFLISEGPKPCFWQTVHAKSLFLKISYITDFLDFYRFCVPSWLPKSTQNPPKIDKKLIRKDVENMMLCLIVFFSIFGGFWAPSWEPCWGYVGQKTSKKWLPKNELKKWLI